MGASRRHGPCAAYQATGETLLMSACLRQLVYYFWRVSDSEYNEIRHYGTRSRSILSSSLAACSEHTRETNCCLLASAVPLLVACGRKALHNLSAHLQAQGEDMHYAVKHGLPRTELPCRDASSSHETFLILPTCSNRMPNA